MLIGSTGRMGMGKTTLAMNIAERVERRLIIDPKKKIRRFGATVASTARGLRSAMPALAEGDIDEVVYSPTEVNLKSAFAAYAEELRTWALEHPDLELAAVVDEASFFGDLSKNDAFMYAVKCSDHEQLHVILTCHRPSELPTDLRAIMNRWCLFRTTLAHDIDAVKAHCSSDVVDLVQQLEGREFVEWNDDDGTYDVHRHAYVWHTELQPRGAESSILYLQ